MHDACMKCEYVVQLRLHITHVKIMYGHVLTDPRVSVWPEAGRPLPSCCWPVPGRVYGTGCGRSLRLRDWVEGREVEGRGHAGELGMQLRHLAIFHAPVRGCSCFGKCPHLEIWYQYGAIIMNLAVLPASEVLFP